jgi:hypothetical protein
MTIQRYALVDSTGVVQNIILWDGSSPLTLASGVASVQSDVANIGDTYNSGAFESSLPLPTLAEQAQALLNSTVAITSTNTPALDGTYSITSSDQSHINAVITNIMLNNTFPGGVSSYAWPDADGTLHTFPDTTTFKSFATAIAGYVAALYGVAHGTLSALPSNSITIA